MRKRRLVRPRQKGHGNQVVMQSGSCAESIPAEELAGKRGAGINELAARLGAGVCQVFSSLEGLLKARRSRHTGTFSALTPGEDPGRNRFARALARIKHSPYYNSRSDQEGPLGYYEGRHIITEDSRITGGVYLGAIGHEAVVVDEKYGSLGNLYNELIMRFARENTRRDCLEERIFRQVVRLVREKLPLSSDGVRALAFRHHIRPDQKAALDFYIKERKGAARHQVLLAGYLLEKLIGRGLVDGDIRIDPCFAELPGEDEKLFFTTAGGAVFTFDPLSECLP